MGAGRRKLTTPMVPPSPFTNPLPKTLPEHPHHLPVLQLRLTPATVQLPPPLPVSREQEPYPKTHLKTYLHPNPRLKSPIPPPLPPQAVATPPSSQLAPPVVAKPPPNQSNQVRDRTWCSSPTSRQAEMSEEELPAATYIRGRNNIKPTGP